MINESWASRRVNAEGFFDFRAVGVNLRQHLDVMPWNILMGYCRPLQTTKVKRVASLQRAKRFYDEMDKHVQHFDADILILGDWNARIREMSGDKEWKGHADRFIQFLDQHNIDSYNSRRHEALRRVNIVSATRVNI